MSPPFAKVLIANRGEIAVRVMQTCRELGIATVAVYSTADPEALHVQVADEAYCIGPPAALESYLSIGAILDAARRSGAEAIHPGYGFLAENSEFAQAVGDAGLVWIGPGPGVIALMGDKVAAKRLAESAGVPTVPGYSGNDTSVERLAVEAERIGYPVMLKAAAGGGGKGMRTVQSAAELPGAVEGAQREAAAAFGDERVFLEKLLEHPRHIEIQVLADAHGNAVYLGERDCSLQRRHQKVVEEAPSPVLTEELRSAMGESALRLVRASGYTNAGTVEFLFSRDRFYFLEMNTRLQVEHPVTEAITGLDLVAHQLAIAAGQPLGFGQLDVKLRGHAIEVRLYAEDPGAGFLPATGPVALFAPPQGPGVRNDVGVFTGWEVGPWYDPLLAKLVVHAETRAEAVARLRDALSRYRVLGLTTNLGFLHWLTLQPDFQAGRADTSFIAASWTPPAAGTLPPEVLLGAAGFDLTDTSAVDPWATPGGWRAAGAARTLLYQFGEDEVAVSLERQGDGWRATIDGRHWNVRLERPSANVVMVRDGERVFTVDVARTGGSLALSWNGTTYRLDPARRETATRAVGKAGGSRLVAPMPGTVVKVAVTAGDEVAAHQPLVVMEAMKMEHVIEAPAAGRVDEILVAVGDLVPAGAPVVRLEES